MSRKFLKIASLIVSIAVMAAAPAGCGKSPADGGTQNSGSGAASGGKSSDPLGKYAPVEGKRYKIAWTCGLTLPLEKDAELVKYWNEKFNVELDIWDIENNKYSELLNLKLASGEVPDKIFIKGLDTFAKYQAQDMLMELPEDVLKKYAPDMYIKAEKDIPGVYNYGKIDGKLYGLPHTVANSIFRTPIVMRGDWLKNLGITKLPETLEEFEKIIYSFAKDDPDKNRKNDTYGLSKSALDAVYGAFGYIPANWQDKGGKLVFGGIQPEMKDALKLINKWYKDGVLDPEFITGENQGGYWAISHAFVNGRIGTSAHGAYYHWKPASFQNDEEVGSYPELKKLNPEAAASLKFIMPPKGPKGQAGITQGNLVDGAVSAFGKHLEKEPDKVGKILQILNYTNASSEENLLTAVYGVKDKHWAYTEDKGIKRLIEKLPAQIGGNIVMLATVPPSIYFALYPGRQEFAKERKLDAGGIQNKLVVSLPSSGKYTTELNKLRDEAYISIITGDKPIDFFDEFVQKWKKAGGEQLEKEGNEWYAKQAK